MRESEIYKKAEETKGLDGMTVNERLFVSGLLDEFDDAMKNDKKLARLILEALRVDKDSVKKILENE